MKPDRINSPLLNHEARSIQHEYLNFNDDTLWYGKKIDTHPMNAGRFIHCSGQQHSNKLSRLFCYLVHSIHYRSCEYIVADQIRVFDDIETLHQKGLADANLKHQGRMVSGPIGVAYNGTCFGKHAIQMACYLGTKKNDTHYYQEGQFSWDAIKLTNQHIPDPWGKATLSVPLASLGLHINGRIRCKTWEKITRFIENKAEENSLSVFSLELRQCQDLDQSSPTNYDEVNYFVHYCAIRITPNRRIGFYDPAEGIFEMNLHDFRVFLLNYYQYEEYTRTDPDSGKTVTEPFHGGILRQVIALPSADLPLEIEPDQ